MRRFLALLASATLLVAMLPGVVAAGPSVRFEDHRVGFGCEQPFDGGFVSVFIDTSTAFGDFAAADVWLDPAVPFEESPTMSGWTDLVERSEDADQVDLRAAFTVFDAEGNELGDGLIVATLTPASPAEPIDEVGQGNRKSIVQGTRQAMTVAASLTMPGVQLELDSCGGERSDVSVFETDPTAFVNANEGTYVDCFWETPDATAYLYVIEDESGSYADAFLATAEQMLFAQGATASVSPSAMSASIDLVNDDGDPFTADASATLAPSGGPVTSTLLSATSKEKLVEQGLTPEGELAFSSGETFTIDESSCRGVAFATHFRNSGPAGPKVGGKAPPNDGPEGAIAVASGTGFNVQTTGTSLAAEIQVTACPEGDFDAMGHTVWYTIEGTGEPVSIDSAGSNFDTVMAVFVRDGSGFEEVACIDDVFGDPVGVTFQAALTLDTIEGQTYFVEVGGWQNFFNGDTDSGRLRLWFD